MRILVSFLIAAGLAAQDARLGKRLDDYLSRCADHGWSGAALIARDGEVLVGKGYGLANRETGTANTENTLFEIASATKQFTAAAILKLEEQGKLRTSDPIGKHLPGVPEARKHFTIYQLLTHTTGMPRRATGGHGADLAAAVGAFLRTEPVRKPDTKFEYWNGGYALLAGIVERASGTSYTDYCRKNLFEPAGLKNTGFTGDDDLGAPEAVGYERDKRQRSALEHPYGSYGWQYRGMGGAVSTVEDLYRWDRALLGDDVLAKKTREKLFRTHLGNYACGWYVLDKPRRKITHGGDVRGFHTQYMRYPDDDATIVITSNVDDVPLWTVSFNIEAILFGTKLRYPKPPEVAKLAAAKLADLPGTYRISETERVVLRRTKRGLRVGALGREAAVLMDDSVFARVKKRSFPEEENLAVRIVEGLAKGDVALLREKMNARIPRRWPDTIKDELWPRRTATLGAMRSARVVEAAKGYGSRVRILILQEHEKGRTHTKIEFAQGALVVLDLRGPEFAATLDLVPTADDRFERFAWAQKSGFRLRVERGADGRVVAIHVVSAQGKRVRATKVD